VHQFVCEICVNIVFRLSFEHVMFTDLTPVCVNNYIITLCSRSKPENGG
jgi:hypothetical protein